MPPSGALYRLLRQVNLLALQLRCNNPRRPNQTTNTPPSVMMGARSLLLAPKAGPQDLIVVFSLVIPPVFLAIRCNIEEQSWCGWWGS